jgi:hypothetical protein
VISISVEAERAEGLLHWLAAAGELATAGSAVAKGFLLDFLTAVDGERLRRELLGCLNATEEEVEQGES